MEKNASEVKSGAGQYFTVRALIDSMVHVMKPTLDDIIQDPAAGTCGFHIPNIGFPWRSWHLGILAVHLFPTFLPS